MSSHMQNKETVVSIDIGNMFIKSVCKKNDEDSLETSLGYFAFYPLEEELTEPDDIIEGFVSKQDIVYMNGKPYLYGKNAVDHAGHEATVLESVMNYENFKNIFDGLVLSELRKIGIKYEEENHIKIIVKYPSFLSLLKFKEFSEEKSVIRDAFGTPYENIRTDFVTSSIGVISGATSEGIFESLFAEEEAVIVDIGSSSLGLTLCRIGERNTPYIIGEHSVYINDFGESSILSEHDLSFPEDFYKTNSVSSGNVISELSNCFTPNSHFGFRSESKSDAVLKILKEAINKTVKNNTLLQYANCTKAIVHGGGSYLVGSDTVKELFNLNKNAEVLFSRDPLFSSAVGGINYNSMKEAQND